MAIAGLTKADYVAIAEAYQHFILTTTGPKSIEIGHWPAILGDALFRRAFQGGYFGPKGSQPGFPPPEYADLKVKGVQVTTLQREVADGGNVAQLWVDGDLVAEEAIHGTVNFDQVAFAKRHGYDI